MFVCTRSGVRRASSLLSRSGLPPHGQAGLSSTQLKFSRSESTSASGSSSAPNDSSSPSSSSFDPESSNASQKRLPYPAHFLKLRNRFNPSPLSPNYISKRLIKGKGPHQRSQYALRKPIENDIAGTPGHHFMKWRASWHINRRRVNLWREAKNQWRHKLRKEGVIPPYIPRTSGAGTKTPRVKYVMSKHRPGRMYIRGRDGRPRRMTTKWLVFPDGRRVRKVGWRRVNKGRIILASVAKVKLHDQWTRPIAPGRLEVYDHAMELLAQDRTKLKQEIVDLRKAVRQLEEFSPEWQKLKDKINILEIQSDINQPSVRWDVQHGHYDFKNATHRHLVEDKWRKQGRLDLLMERVYQMGVVPDLLPNFHPNIDVHVEFPIRPPHGKAYAEEAANRTKPRYADMEPGRYLLPNQTLEPPIVRARAFHVDPRQYTLVMVDPDVPDVNNGTYQSFLHWVVPNITLSIHSTSFRLKLSQLPQLSYIPPHPQQGTNYHRYTIFLLRQTKQVNLPAHESIQRLGFNLREFVREHKLLVPDMPVSPVEYPPLPDDVQPGNPRWVGRADPNLIEGGIPGGIRPGGIPGMPGPMGGREARWAVPKGVRQNAGISGRSGGRGKEDEIGGGVFMWREEHDGEDGVVHKIYEEILQVPEPKYARPKRGDPLEAVKRVKKYNFARY